MLTNGCALNTGIQPRTDRGNDPAECRAHSIYGEKVAASNAIELPYALESSVVVRVFGISSFSEGDRLITRQRFH